MNSQAPIPALPRKQRNVRSNRKIVFLLFLFFIIIFILLFFHSSLSKISYIEIEGNQFTDASEIGQAAGIRRGDSYFFVRSEAAEKRIEQLEYVKNATVTKKFPGRVLIEIEEFPHVALELTDEGDYTAILANGAIVALEAGQVMVNKPVLTGWENHAEMKLRLTEVLGEIPDEYLLEISEIRPFPSASYPDKIKLYTRSFYEVITTIGKLPEKIVYLDNMLADLRERGITSGQLLLLEADIHAPFPEEGEDGQETSSENMTMDEKNGKNER